MRKKILLALAVAGGLVSLKAPAISLDDIQFWTGAGSNRAAMIIEWHAPEVFNSTTVPSPATTKTLVWGYRFNGASSGTAMLNAILAADTRLYAVEGFGGSFVEGLGYHLKGTGAIGITDGTVTNFTSNGVINDPSANVDAAHSIEPTDLYWGGLSGPGWELWNETGATGGFLSSPNRGTNSYWAPPDTNAPYFGSHGQWDYGQLGLNISITNGSWLGWTISAGGYNYLDDNDPGTVAYNFHKHAPPSPVGNYAAYICSTNDFAAQIVDATNVYQTSPYNITNAMIGRPTLKFIDHFNTHQANIVHRSKLIEPPYWTDPASNNVITEITSNGIVTMNMGRKIYDDPNNPYGVDLIVFGNSFYSASGFTGLITDFTDENSVVIPGGSTGTFGHLTKVSVSPDGTNWFTYPSVATLLPDDTYQWDRFNHTWQDEEMDETKPVNPAMSFAGGTAMPDALNHFANACGGTGFDLKPSGFPWIQYVRILAGTNYGDYTVIDSIGAVNPTAVGDSLTVVPANIMSNTSTLLFQNPGDLTQTLVGLNFTTVSTNVKVTAISQNEFSSYAPVIGKISRGYKITAAPVTGTNTVSYAADISLGPDTTYSGDGSDLRVYQWSGTDWTLRGFSFNATNRLATVTGVTNLSAFAVSQIVPPQVTPMISTNGLAFRFTPVPNIAQMLERSTNLVNWSLVQTIPPTNSSTVTVIDSSAPVDQAFYRIHLIVP